MTAYASLRASTPSDFADFLNANLAHEWIERAGKLAVRLFAKAPRALFFPDGLWWRMAASRWPICTRCSPRPATGTIPPASPDFVWTRAHPKARKKLPNRYSRGSQFGHEDFAAFCALSRRPRPARHPHGARPRSRRGSLCPLSRLSRPSRADHRRAVAPPRAASVSAPTSASRPWRASSRAPFRRFIRLHIPPEMVRDVYPEPELADGAAAEPEETEE